MRKFLTLLPLIALVSGCSDKENLEDKGRQADSAIAKARSDANAQQDKIEAKARIVEHKAQGVQREVKADLKKVDNAVEAADAELKK